MLHLLLSAAWSLHPMAARVMLTAYCDLLESIGEWRLCPRYTINPKKMIFDHLGQGAPVPHMLRKIAQVTPRPSTLAVRLATGSSI